MPGSGHGLAPRPMADESSLPDDDRQDHSPLRPSVLGLFGPNGRLSSPPSPFLAGLAGLAAQPSPLASVLGSIPREALAPPIALGKLSRAGQIEVGRLSDWARTTDLSGLRSWLAPDDRAPTTNPALGSFASAWAKSRPAQGAFSQLGREATQWLPRSSGIDLTSLTLGLPAERFDALREAVVGLPLSLGLDEEVSASVKPELDEAVELVAAGDLLTIGDLVRSLLTALVTRAQVDNPIVLLAIVSTLLQAFFTSLSATVAWDEAVGKKRAAEAERAAEERAHRVLKAVEELHADMAQLMASTAATRSDSNLRRGPGTQHEVLRVLAAGTEVSIHGVREGWCRVSLDADGTSYDGWVSAELLSGPD